MPGNFEKRLTKSEEALAKKAQEQELGKCNCGDPNVIFRPRPGVEMATQLREELERTCPVHPARRLGRLLWGVAIGADGKRIANPKMDPILEEYHRRRAAQFKDLLEADAEDV